MDEPDPPVPLPHGPGTEPVDLVAALVGFVAPPTWEAMAVVVQGRSWRLDDGTADPRPVRLTHVVDRGGSVASVLRHLGEAAQPPDDGGEGRLVDVCRRALDLPTPDPPEDTVELWALLWLDNLLARVARGERIRGLVAAAHAHPAIELVAQHEPHLLDEAVARLVRLGRILGQQRTWSKLRTACVAGDWPVEDLTPEGAAWMDDGMFARWVLDDFPSADDYLDELADLVPPSVVEAVHEVLVEWSLC